MLPLCLPLMASNPIAGFFRSLFGGERHPDPEELTAQSVFFYVSQAYRDAHLMGDNPDYGPIRELEAACLAAIAAAGTGHAFNGGGFSSGYGEQFSFNGPDARALYESTKDILMNSEITRGGKATLLFGDANDAPHEDILLTPR